VPLQDLLIGTGGRLDDVVLPGAFVSFEAPHLTPAQLAALDEGPGRVRAPVELERFSEASQLNNFALYFADASSIAGVIYQRIRCNRRFAIGYPEFADFLRAHYLVLRDSRVISEEKERVLLHAYELMVGLVDRDDPGVIDDRGYVNRRYLWQ
jgi:hypothetical protein